MSCTNTHTHTLTHTNTHTRPPSDELWTLLNFVAREEFKDRAKFVEDFGDLKSAAQLENLHKSLKPYVLRREKEHVEKSVPPKEEVIIDVELTVPQKQYYRAIYEQNTAFLYKGNPKDGPRLTNLAMELRKCCNHPYLVKGAETEISKHFVDDSPLEVMVKSSGKLMLLDKLLPKLKTDGHRVLIFSQFRIMLNIIEDYLNLRYYSYERVDGAVTGKKRQCAIDRYQSATGGAFIMLLSTRAGGVGINLTAADTVIIFDSDWNPQNDLQAQARAHRIGQTKSVKVYRLLTRKTYETVMFKAASIKLGLDYAVMHNMHGQGGNSTAGVSGVSADRVEHVSGLSKKELENLLKHGAYDIFREEKEGQSIEESNKFCEADIDQILSRSAVVIHDGKKSGTAYMTGIADLS
jgi:chromodomain-helicase-DNA-binding protein 6